MTDVLPVECVLRPGSVGCRAGDRALLRTVAGLRLVFGAHPDRCT